MSSSKTNSTLAALILRDIEQLKERAQVHGVTAYLGRPVQRERPNERFLSHTIRSVQHANKRAEEGELWARYELERERTKGRSRSRSPRRRRASPAEGSGRSSEREGSQGEARAPPPAGAFAAPGGSGGGWGGVDDEHVARMLASKRTRGRGSIGARMDEAGPYMAPPEGGGELLNEDTGIVRRAPLGPDRPEGRRPAAGAESDLGVSGSSSDDSDRRRRRRRTTSGKSPKSKRERESKQRKKEREEQKREKKEKRDKKKKRRKGD